MGFNDIDIEFGFKLLFSDLNLSRPTDLPTENFTVGEVIPPSGISPTTHFIQIQAAESKYCDCLDYDLFPGTINGYYSNSFAAGVVGVTGGSFGLDVGDYFGGKNLCPHNTLMERKSD